MSDVVYSNIEITDKTMFIDPIDIGKTKHNKNYKGDMCSLILYDVSQDKVNDIKKQILANKTKYYAGKTASNIGTISAGIAKGLFKGAKGFAKGMSEEFENIKKNY